MGKGVSVFSVSTVFRNVIFSENKSVVATDELSKYFIGLSS